MSKIKMTAKIVSQSEIAASIFSMVIAAPEIASEAKAGQFVSLYTNDGSKLLPRPISLCEVDKEAGTLRMVYRIAGKGTEMFSKLTAGDTIDVLGPLGNGYDIKGEKPVLMGGGIGIPPMLELAKTLSRAGVTKENLTVILGYRDEAFLLEEFEKIATVIISSDAGTIGIKGTVITAATEKGVTGDMIYSCGPTPMLRAVKAYAAENGIKAQISLEEKMACGIGACLACVCKTKEIDDHSKVNNTRICKDGPCFYAEEVEI